MPYKALSNSILVFVLLTTQFHLLRNFTPYYYLLFLSSFVLSFFYIINNYKCLSIAEKNTLAILTLLIIYPLMPGFLGCILGLYSSFDEVVVAFSRVIFCLPIYFVIVGSRDDKKTIVLTFNVVIFVTLLASLSLPYQHYFGEISWFAGSSERAGISRFASLFGSLTAFGVVCGFGLIAAAVAFKSMLAFSFVAALIIFGSILSLQKAAIVNVALAFLLIPYLINLRPKNLLLITLFFAVIALGAISSFFDEIAAYLKSFRFSPDSESEQSDDYSLVESIYLRLVDLPATAIDYHGLDSLYFGIGPKGGSGAFGFPEVPMSHNGIVDLFLVGGVIYFLIFMFFLLIMLNNIYFANKNAIDRKFFYFGVFVFAGVLLNMPFSGLVFFTPSNAMFFALAVKIILLCKVRKI